MVDNALWAMVLALSISPPFSLCLRSLGNIRHFLDGGSERASVNREQLEASSEDLFGRESRAARARSRTGKLLRGGRQQRGVCVLVQIRTAGERGTRMVEVKAERVSECVCAALCVCVSVCLCESEREEEGGRESERFCVCIRVRTFVCVCVCVRE